MPSAPYRAPPKQLRGCPLATDTVVHVHSNPHDAVGVATAISGLLAENNVNAGDGIAGLMIVLMAATRPDLTQDSRNVGPFIHDISVAIAEWQAPIDAAGEVGLGLIPEVPGGLSNAN